MQLSFESMTDSPRRIQKLKGNEEIESPLLALFDGQNGAVAVPSHLALPPTRRTL